MTRGDSDHAGNLKVDRFSQTLEQSHADAKQDRSNMKVELVDQAGGDRLAHDLRTA